MKTIIEAIWTVILSIFYFFSLLFLGIWAIIKDLFKKE
tara:strand:+ start:4745 stop:4858 length:114 start_codon:yes stop_codon:yes gene_type:complete